MPGLSPQLLPVELVSQLVPGPCVHAVHHLVDNLDLSVFDTQYRSDYTWADDQSVMGWMG